MYGSKQFQTIGNVLELAFPMEDNSDANQGYAYLYFYASGAGRLVIKGVVVRCTRFESYKWAYDFGSTGNPPITDKIYVKAIRVYLLTRSSGKTESKDNTSIVVGDRTISRSGQDNYTWRLYTETIEVPNNGT